MPLIMEQGPVHTVPEKLKNGTLFLWFGPSSTLIRHENGAFRKRSSNRKNLKTPALRLVWMENILKSSFSKWMAPRYSCDFLDRDFPKHKSKMTGNCCVFYFSGVVWTKNIWCVFRVKTPFLNFSGLVWTSAQSAVLSGVYFWNITA